MRSRRPGTITAGVPRLVCFDLDGTVMSRPNSLQFLLQLNHAPVDVLVDIDRREAAGQVDWVAADYERAPLLAGLPVDSIEANLDAQLETIGNLQPVLCTLQAHGLITALVTSGPIEVAEAIARRFAFNHAVGSLFEVAGVAYTGRITRHLGSAGKVEELLRLSDAEGISLEECVAVGDGYSDHDLFERAGLAIGLNCPAEVAALARHVVTGDDLSAILPLILGAGQPPSRRP